MPHSKTRKCGQFLPTRVSSTSTNLLISKDAVLSAKLPARILEQNACTSRRYRPRGTIRTTAIPVSAADAVTQSSEIHEQFSGTVLPGFAVHAGQP